ncbi:sugar isomerase domain-containing protein [Nocardiopsis suaedae]|uniref:Sugar isomerase domain-containing protein n=1 Tax=Nocardiopsis suaedae TaxID=3018444 RepID=A0ABT4TTS1_9ACTN|nr:sugar isomerase domain-containing protein [Nocardiopsis suaedae]MDA2808090.1 sugar isomerase domain-containing protein [Nocardiopsis suaedae]
MAVTHTEEERMDAYHGGGDFGARMRDRLEEVQRANADVLEEVAALVVERAVRGDGMVLVAGSGHSMIAVAEAFFRAGGLAPVKPLYHPDLLPLHGAAAATAAERRSGLADEVLDGAGADADRGDLLFVFSTSGVNPYPVELARGARGRGLPVVAFTSRACAAAAPRRAGGTLAEDAGLVVDTLVDPGDAAYPQADPVTAPLSSLANSYLWNLLLASVHDRVRKEDLEPPLWRSANMPGGDEANQRFFSRYGPRVPELG